MEEDNVIKYPLGDVFNRPVINIAGRDYVVMPFFNESSLSKQVIEGYKKHNKLDYQDKQLNNLAMMLLHDIMHKFQDTLAITAHKEAEDKYSITYRAFIPLLMPVDTKELWTGDELTMERRMQDNMVSRKETGKPYIFKLME